MASCSWWWLLLSSSSSHTHRPFGQDKSPCTDMSPQNSPIHYFLKTREIGTTQWNDRLSLCFALLASHIFHWHSASPLLSHCFSVTTNSLNKSKSTRTQQQTYACHVHNWHRAWINCFVQILTFNNVINIREIERFNFCDYYIFETKTMFQFNVLSQYSLYYSETCVFLSILFASTWKASLCSRPFGVFFGFEKSQKSTSMSPINFLIWA